MVLSSKDRTRLSIAKNLAPSRLVHQKNCKEVLLNRGVIPENSNRSRRAASVQRNSTTTRDLCLLANSR